MYNSNNVAEMIKFAAKEKGISVKQLLIDVGLGRNTMSNFKTSMPKADNLAKIADYLGCSVDYLLGRTDVPQSEPASLSEEEAELLQRYRSLDEQGRNKVDEYLSDCLRLYGLVRQELPNGYAITTNRHEIPPAVLEEAEALRKKV